jgi:hypothetical protein
MERTMKDRVRQQVAIPRALDRIRTAFPGADTA